MTTNLDNEKKKNEPTLAVGANKGTSDTADENGVTSSSATVTSPNGCCGTRKKGLWTRIKSVKHIEIIIAVALAVIAICVYFVVATVDKSKDKQSGGGDASGNISDQIGEILSKIDGVGPCNVLITYDGEDQNIFAMEDESRTDTVIDSDGNSERETTTTITNSKPILVNVNGVMQPVILSTVPAPIDGVVVVAQGGDRPEVRLRIIDAVCALLDVDGNKIKVFKMQ